MVVHGLTRPTGLTCLRNVNKTNFQNQALARRLSACPKIKVLLNRLQLAVVFSLTRIKWRERYDIALEYVNRKLQAFLLRTQEVGAGRVNFNTEKFLILPTFKDKVADSSLTLHSSDRNANQMAWTSQVTMSCCKRLVQFEIISLGQAKNDSRNRQLEQQKVELKLE